MSHILKSRHHSHSSRWFTLTDLDLDPNGRPIPTLRADKLGTSYHQFRDSEMCSN